MEKEIAPELDLNFFNNFKKPNDVEKVKELPYKVPFMHKFVGFMLLGAIVVSIPFAYFSTEKDEKSIAKNEKIVLLEKDVALNNILSEKAKITKLYMANDILLAKHLKYFKEISSEVKWVVLDKISANNKSFEQSMYTIDNDLKSINKIISSSSPDVEMSVKRQDFLHGFGDVGYKVKTFEKWKNLKSDSDLIQPLISIKKSINDELAVLNNIKEDSNIDSKNITSKKNKIK